MHGLLTGPLVFWRKLWTKFGAPYWASPPKSSMSSPLKLPNNNVEAAGESGAREARGVVGIAVAIGSGGEMPDFHSKIDIHLQRRPRHKVVELGSVVFRVETEIRRCASVRIGVLKAVGGAGHHEPGLVRGQVLNHCQQAGCRILDRDADPIALM